MSYAKYVLVPIMKKYGVIKEDGTLNSKSITSPAISTTVISVKEKSEPQTVNTSTKTKKNETSVKKVDKKMLKAKRKGRGYSILNTAMGLTDSIKTKKKTLLG